MDTIKIALVGVGNCASSLVQGIHYYKTKDATNAVGLMHCTIGGFSPDDIEVVAAFDIDERKVGKDVSEAIFAPPNCTTRFCPEIPKLGVEVHMGQILDSISDHMRTCPPARTFVPANMPQPSQQTVVDILKHSGAEMLLNYLPVGSQKAVEFYATCALEASLGFINNMPVFIASDFSVFLKPLEGTSGAGLGGSSLN